MVQNRKKVARASLGFGQPRTQALLSWFRLHYLLQKKHKIK